MTLEQYIIVFSWLALAITGIVGQILLGLPRKGSAFSWHMVLLNAVVWIEAVGFLLTGISLWPAAFIVVVSEGIMIWRVVLLVKIRREAKRERASSGTAD